MNDDESEINDPELDEESLGRIATLFSKGLSEKQLHNFESRIERTGGCWIWTGLRNFKGYGQIRLSHRRGCSRIYRSHRLAYFLYIGTFDERLLVLHECDTPACVNPEHLKIGTPKDNMIDKVSRGRAKAGRGRGKPKDGYCWFGHLRTDENTFIGSSGRRQCRVCLRNKDREREVIAKKKRDNERRNI